MDIAGRDGDRACLHACARLLQRRSIRAAAQQDFALRGYTAVFRRLLERIHNRRCADNRAVQHLDCRSLAQLDRHRGLHLRQVAGIGHIHRDSRIRLNCERCRACAAQANLLLCRKHEVQVVLDFLVRQLLHHQQERHAADTVVQIRTAQHAVLLEPRCLVHSEITDLHQLARFLGILCADVDEQIIQRQILKRRLFLVRDHAARAVGKLHLNIQQVTDIQAADLRKTDKALVLNIGGNHADRVHMRGKQQLFAILCAFFAADKVSERVRRHVVDIRACNLRDGFANRILTAGRAECTRDRVP